MAHHVLGTAGRLEDVLLVAPQGARVAEHGQAHLGVADDGGQHVVEVVGDAAGQRADGLHLLGLHQLLLEFDLVGDVAAQSDEALDLARRGAGRRDAHVLDAVALAGAGREGAGPGLARTQMGLDVQWHQLVVAVEDAAVRKLVAGRQTAQLAVGRVGVLDAALRIEDHHALGCAFHHAGQQLALFLSLHQGGDVARGRDHGFAVLIVADFGLDAPVDVAALALLVDEAPLAGQRLACGEDLEDLLDHMVAHRLGQIPDLAQIATDEVEGAQPAQLLDLIVDVAHVQLAVDTRDHVRRVFGQSAELLLAAAQGHLDVALLLDLLLELEVDALELLGAAGYEFLQVLAVLAQLLFGLLALGYVAQHAGQADEAVLFEDWAARGRDIAHRAVAGDDAEFEGVQAASEVVHQGVDELGHIVGVGAEGEVATEHLVDRVSGQAFDGLIGVREATVLVEGEDRIVDVFGQQLVTAAVQRAAGLLVQGCDAQTLEHVHLLPVWPLRGSGCVIVSKNNGNPRV
ncbi:MAG: hypothetical protein BWY87_01078 [Deltaproteobacteria bacterium ADurb.Bin510]|nr:MAG: hypothetical protein BWY87_01078 [Deltaproteobacteria bacterium ADurb.Bin510]